MIQGPGTFIMVARGGFDDYPDLIRAQHLQEILPPLLLAGAGGAAEGTGEGG